MTDLTLAEDYFTTNPVGAASGKALVMATKAPVSHDKLVERSTPSLSLFKGAILTFIRLAPFRIAGDPDSGRPLAEILTVALLVDPLSHPHWACHVAKLPVLLWLLQVKQLYDMQFP